MKHIEIWQLPIESKYKFMSYDFASKQGFSIKDYELKYSCNRADNYTEDSAFNEFNNKRPVDYRTHSLSVSDIVKIDGKYMYCDSFGWQELSIKA